MKIGYTNIAIKYGIRKHNNFLLNLYLEKER